MAFDFTLVFPHIAKTGGTSVLNHFMTHLPPDEFMVKGPHSAVRKLRMAQPQIDQLTAEELSRIRVMQGHGVSELTLTLFDPARVRLMVVLRDPVAWLRSSHTQANIARENSGRPPKDIGTFLGAAPVNGMSEKLVRDFPSFAGDPARPLRDRVLSVLRCFDMVVATERMTDQLRPFFAALGLPDEMEQRRKGKSAAELPISADEIRGRHDVDAEIAAIAAESALGEDLRLNGFGFDAEARAAGLGRLQEAVARGERRTLSGEIGDQLARGLCLRLVAPAAIALLQDDGADLLVANRAEVLDLIRTQWAAKEARLSDAQKGLAETRSKTWLRGARRMLADRRSRGAPA